MLSNHRVLHAARHRLHALKQASELLGLRTAVTVINAPRRLDPLPTPQKSKETSGRGAKRPAESLQRRGPQAEQPDKLEGPSEIQKPKKLLKPYVLASRLRKLCDEGNIDDAVELLQNMPLDAQTPPVWNTLLLECMKAKRYKLAYRLFTDMKRRGLIPTVRTYGVMLHGFSRIEDWENHTKLLVNVHSLYDSLMKHYNHVKRMDPKSPELDVDPLASYIKILGDTQDFQKMFVVFYGFDLNGRLAPTNIIYTSMFRALASKVSFGEKSSDARLIWQHMTRNRASDSGFQPDSHTIAAALRCFASGNSADHQLGLEIARDFLGLAQPSKTSLPRKIPLSPQSLEAVLELYNNMRAYDLCVRLVHQVRDSSPKSWGQTKSMVDRGHMNQLLRAYVGLAEAGGVTESQAALEALQWMLEQDVLRLNQDIRPGRRTYNLSLAVCQYCKDWTRATRIFHIMTGYRVEELSEDSKGLKRDQRSPGHSLQPDITTMTRMARTALASGNAAHIKQCLRLILDLDYRDARTPAAIKELQNRVNQGRGSRQAELGNTILEMVEIVEESESNGDWKTLKAHARDLIESKV